MRTCENVNFRGQIRTLYITHIIEILHKINSLSVHIFFSYTIYHVVYLIYVMEKIK